MSVRQTTSFQLAMFFFSVADYGSHKQPGISCSGKKTDLKY